MFTGIIQEVGQISALSPKMVIRSKNVVKNVKVGDSIAVNGICLTVTEFKPDSFAVGLMPETLRRTNLNCLNIGDVVNLETPLTLASHIGGHFVQGHIDGTGQIVNMKDDGEAKILTIEAPISILKYVVEKGFVAIDGISLTVIAKTPFLFMVSMVKHTVDNTNMKSHRVGDVVNLEVDIISKYIESFTGNNEGKVSLDFLEVHGFVDGKE